MGKREMICIKKGHKTGLGRAKQKSCWYVTRDKKGQVKTTSNVYRSIAVDKGKKAKFHPKKRGWGHIGDYKRR